LEPGGRAGGDMSHAEYFTTHFSLLAPFFTVYNHGLSRGPRVFLALWVPIAQFCLAMALQQSALLSEAAQIVLVGILILPLRFIVRFLLNKSFGSTQVSCIPGLVAISSIVIVTFLPLIVMLALDLADEVTAERWGISWITGYGVELIELMATRKLAECCPCCPFMHNKQ
jgi:hypothetical protein